MVHFDANTLYTMDELEEMLEGVVSLHVFLVNLGLKKDRIFRDAVWGCEILDAAKNRRSSNVCRPNESHPRRGEPRRGTVRPPSKAERATGKLSASDL